MIVALFAVELKIGITPLLVTFAVEATGRLKVKESVLSTEIILYPPEIICPAIEIGVLKKTVLYAEA